MASFTFDATDCQPWLGAEYDSPPTFALRMWMQYQNGDEDMNFAEACQLARFDREVWDALQEEAWAYDVDALPDAAAALLGRALGRRPPRKRKGATARRDARLRAVAAALRSLYDLNPTQAMPGGGNICAASILAGLPGMPSEGPIANILTVKR
ncbi:hypothetical protein [Loktanella salsilacus]|uniref:hypothetical protein n=1 Tax=Loktanella salsilacus TaxID=195913 RepID=UPI0020B64F57|nr:hypothetical protein [Loktanella salsilacus]UTH45324.1 hypothetical protein KBK07_04415 [Loktanella salsilacus]